MSVAAPVDAMDAGDYPRPGAHDHGVVAVHHYGLGHSAAMCSCGWAGRRRYLKAAAEQDAWVHAMRQKCDIPLVIPVSAA